MVNQKKTVLNRSLILIFLTSVAIVVSALVWFSRSEPTPTLMPTGAAGTNSSFPTFAGDRRSGSTSTPPAVAPSVKLSADLERAENYAAFIADALKRPREGGLFYADFVFNQCQQVNALSEPKATYNAGLQQRAQSALASLRRKCGPVAEQYPDARAFAAMVRDSRAGEDPFPSLTKRFGPMQTEPIPRIEAELTRAKQSGDKLDLGASIEALFPVILMSSAKTNGWAPDLIYAASTAAACEAGSTCTKDIAYLAQCADSPCEWPDRIAQIRDGLSEKDREIFDRILVDIRERISKL